MKNISHGKTCLTGEHVLPESISYGWSCVTGEHVLLKDMSMAESVLLEGIYIIRGHILQ